MKKRCIMIFPQFDNVDLIEELREKYDPLFKHVKPHITLVFPFDSSIETNQLNEHLLNSLKNIAPFPIKLQGITPVKSYGNYLYLNIKEGKERINEIHKRLYTDILEDYIPEWLLKEGYYPHLTVGNINEEDWYVKAIKETKDYHYEFETIVDTVSVEIIDENEDSIIEINVSLDK